MDADEDIPVILQSLARQDTRQSAIKSLSLLATACNPSNQEDCKNLLASACKVHHVLQCDVSNLALQEDGVTYFNKLMRLCETPAESEIIQSYLDKAGDHSKLLNLNVDEGSTSHHSSESIQTKGVNVRTSFENRRRRSEDRGKKRKEARAARAARVAEVQEKDKTKAPERAVAKPVSRPRPRLKVMTHAEFQRTMMNAVKIVFNGVEVAFQKSTGIFEREDPQRAVIVEKPNSAVITLDRNLEEEVVCGLCFGGLHAGDDVLILLCRHIYHAPCLNPIVQSCDILHYLPLRLRTHRCCPLCYPDGPRMEPGEEALLVDDEEEWERDGEDGLGAPGFVSGEPEAERGIVLQPGKWKTALEEIEPIRGTLGRGGVGVGPEEEGRTSGTGLQSVSENLRDPDAFHGLVLQPESLRAALEEVEMMLEVERMQQQREGKQQGAVPRETPDIRWFVDDDMEGGEVMQGAFVSAMREVLRKSEEGGDDWWEEANEEEEEEEDVWEEAREELWEGEVSCHVHDDQGEQH